MLFVLFTYLMLGLQCHSYLLLQVGCCQLHSTKNLLHVQEKSTASRVVQDFPIYTLFTRVNLDPSAYCHAIRNVLNFFLVLQLPSYSSIVLVYVPCDGKNVCASLHKLTNNRCSQGCVGSSVEIINSAAKQERKLPTKKVYVVQLY